MIYKNIKNFLSLFVAILLISSVYVSNALYQVDYWTTKNYKNSKSEIMQLIAKNYKIYEKNNNSQWIQTMQNLAKQINNLQQNEESQEKLSNYLEILSIIYLQNTDSNYKAFTLIIDKKLSGKTNDQQEQYLYDIGRKVHNLKIEIKKNNEELHKLLDNIGKYIVYKKKQVEYANRFKLEISSQDAKPVKDKIVKIQKSLYDTLHQVFTDEEFVNASKYTQNWNMNWSYDIIIPDDMSRNIQWTFKAKDLSISKELYNWKLKWAINWTLKTAIDDLNYKFIIDFITDSNDSFFKISDLELNWKKSEWLSSFTDKLQHFSNLDSFVKFKNESYNRGFNPSSLVTNLMKTNLEWLFSQAWLEPYKKDWNKYYLIISRHFCDSMAQITNGSCSDKDYDEAVKNMTRDADFYYDASAHYFALEPKDKKYFKNFDFKIYISDNKITKINIDVVPAEIDGAFRFNFNNQENLNFSFKNEDWQNILNINFESELDANNNFKEIQASANESKYGNEVLNFAMSLKDQKFEWKFAMNLVSFNFDWTTDDSNNIETLNYNASLKLFPKNKTTISWNFVKNQNGALNLDTEEYWKLNITYSLNNGLVNDFTLFSNLKYNWMALDADVKLKNTKISWYANLSFFMNTLKVDFDWTYDYKGLKLKTTIKAPSALYTINIEQQTIWNKTNFKVDFDLKDKGQWKTEWTLKFNVFWDYTSFPWVAEKITIPTKFKELPTLQDDVFLGG